jgi:hypothetical protein
MAAVERRSRSAGGIGRMRIGLRKSALIVRGGGVIGSGILTVRVWIKLRALRGITDGLLGPCRGYQRQGRDCGYAQKHAGCHDKVSTMIHEAKHPVMSDIPSRRSGVFDRSIIFEATKTDQNKRPPEGGLDVMRKVARLVANHSAAAVRKTSPMPSHASARSGTGCDDDGSGNDNDGFVAVGAACAIEHTMKAATAATLHLDDHAGWRLAGCKRHRLRGASR